MLKKMRWRFIWAAMAAVSAVLLLVAGIINVGNFHLTTMRQERIITEICRYEQTASTDRMDGTGFPVFEHPEIFLPEFEYTTRFFVVHSDADGNIESISREFIASVTEEMAESYAGIIQDRGKKTGYYLHYRYHIFDAADGRTMVFLNCDAEFQFMKNLLILSAAVLILSLLIVFFLIFLLSNRVISPYVRSMERQKRFITDAGHELKTPITSISTSTDVLEMLHGKDEWTENIKKQTGRLSKLIANLITLSRLDEEVPFPEKEEFSLSDAAWESAEPFAAMAEVQGKVFRQEIDEGITLFGDRVSVQQMISILLDNAVKYSGQEGEIRFRVCERHGKNYIEVTNTCQIEDVSEISHLFERFYRLDKSRSRDTGGTGIGLSIAQAIAEANGGKIKADSTDGKIICFTVTF